LKAIFFKNLKINKNNFFGVVCDYLKKRTCQMYPPLFDCIWESLLVMTRALPSGALTELQIQQVCALITGVMPLIPCASCSFHGIAYIAEHPPTRIETGQDAFDWIVAFRNKVNQLTYTSAKTYTSEEAQEDLQKRMQKLLERKLQVKVPLLE
jgi:hypothetical protein